MPVQLKSIEEFRVTVPFTLYEDYAPFPNQKKEGELPVMPCRWACTSGRNGKAKWVPYTTEALGAFRHI